MQRAWGSRTIEFQREKSLEYFIKGLKPTVKKIFWGEESEDLDIAYEKARTRELYLTSKKGKYEARAIGSEGPREPRLNKPAAQEANSDMKELLSSMKLMM